MNQQAMVETFSVMKKQKTILSTKTEIALDVLKNEACQKMPQSLKRKRKGLPHFAPDCYLNRELSWIKFNRRVLSEAGNARTPLLERVKFLAIVSANIDEFYMKRLGGLKQQIGAGVTQVTVDGRTPRMQLEQCRLVLLSLQKEKEVIYHTVLEELAKHAIRLCSWSSLDDGERRALREYYRSDIWPLITPLGIDHSHPFPFISNLSLNLLITLNRPGNPGFVNARIKIPTGSGIPRFVQVGEGHKFIRIEDLLIPHIDDFFPETEIVACDVFRITRNAITENDHSGMEDMLEVIASELRDRRFAPVVRLQTSTSMRSSRKRNLAAQLGLDEENDVFESAGMVCMSDLMEIASLDIPELRDPPHRPVNNVQLNLNPSIFESIRAAESILLQHPYESFVTSVEHFVREASEDPQVAAIKMTLYRTSADTKIVEYLINAARNGKQVAVIVELKARFDEEANIRWASRLEQAGVHVSYGVADLKTHCKTILIIRKEKDGLQRYAHIGSGNYHAGTARHYSDIGLLTCEDELTADLSELFNYLTTGCHPTRNYVRILAAPRVIKAELINKIFREVSLHSSDSPGLIRLKTNALEDPDITAALYAASCAGVKVELVVRDICRLKPGIKDFSDNIHVVSIVGRFLEHSRIYYFRNAGDEEYYIGSADLMTRNLERRVELLVPIDNAGARQALNKILEEQLSDNYCAWDMQHDGSYSHRQSSDPLNPLNCQEAAIRDAEKRICHSPNQRIDETNRSINRWLRLCF